MILQLQFALFQSTQLQFVVARLMAKDVDDRVEIAMLDFELNDAPL